MTAPLYQSVLVTGGGGMLAHAFRSVLAARRINATFLSHQQCRISDPGQVAEWMERVRPSLLINCAAYTKVDLAEQEPALADAANGIAPGFLAMECKKHGTTLVHFSTDYVFDGSSRRPWRTDDRPNPQGRYGRSKLLGERAIQMRPPDRWLIIRTAWLYGPNGSNFVQTMLNAARAGKPLRVVDDQVGAPTYTFDLAMATLDLLDREATGVWHLTNAGSVTWYGFTKAILEEFGLTADLAPTTSAEWKKLRPQSATRPAYSVLDLEPFETLVGRPVRPWREALHAYRLRLEAESAPPA